MIKQDVYDEVQGLEPLCQEICHVLWNHQNYLEMKRSANFLRKILSEGFTIENNEHLEHAFIAEYGKGNQLSQFLENTMHFLDYHKKQILKKKWYPKMVSDTDVDTIC